MSCTHLDTDLNRQLKLRNNLPDVVAHLTQALRIDLSATSPNQFAAQLQELVRQLQKIL